jgi:ATP-dependent Lon protease
VEETEEGKIYKLNSDENRPPVLNGFVEEHLYRKVRARNVNVQGIRPEEKVNGLIRAVMPAKVLYTDTDLSPGHLQMLLKGYRKRVIAEINRNLNTAPAEQQQKAELEMKDFVVAQHKAQGNKLFSATLLTGIAQQPDDQLTSPLTHGLVQVMKDMRSEAESISNVATDDVNRLIERLDDLSAKGTMPKNVRLAIRREIERMAGQGERNPEADMVRAWVDRALSLPWEKSPDVPIDLKRAQAILDQDHYDMEKVKEHIISFLATRKQNPDAPPKYLCFVGGPGLGKTSISKSIAKALGRSFSRISVDGITDEHEIKGHRRTYVGAVPGMITEAIKSSGFNNPVLLVDEIDKLGGAGDPKSQAAKSAMLSVLDPEQNKEFTDSYYGFPYPLNDVFFILTANYEDQIPPALKDRVEVIRLDRYADETKFQIAKRHLLPRVMKHQGLKPDQFEITDDALNKIIQQYTREPGVRTLERKIRRVAEVVTTQRQKSDNPDAFPKVTVSAAELEQKAFLGPATFKKPKRITGEYTGEITGLAYTDYGGNTLIAQVNALPDRDWRVGTVTGNLQEVMRESASYSLGYLKTVMRQFKLKEDFEKAQGAAVDIHFPAAAVPKDGPSAGVTITTAIVSELTGIPVRPEVAMTGEIDIKGRVLPIGGLKEKVDAAYRAGITEVFIPQDNANDVNEIPPNQLQAVKIIPVKHIKEILTQALARDPFKSDAEKTTPRRTPGFHNQHNVA